MSENENTKKDETTDTLPAPLRKLPQNMKDRFKDQRAIKYKQTAPDKIALKGNLEDWIKSATESFGTADPDLIDYFFDQVARTSFGLTHDNYAEHLNKLTPMLRGINPQDEVEGMLACQMVGVHNLAMEMMKRAMLEGQTVNGVTENVNRATKLLRTFTTQMEALNRHRGKGQHKMTVEHVHVYQGGQAIVGNVNQGEGGKNEKRKSTP